jgi:hypothetical protein
MRCDAMRCEAMRGEARRGEAVRAVRAVRWAMRGYWQTVATLPRCVLVAGYQTAQAAEREVEVSGQSHMPAKKKHEGWLVIFRKKKGKEEREFSWSELNIFNAQGLYSVAS